MAKKGGKKKGAKDEESGSKSWLQIALAVIVVFIMIGVVFTTCLNPKELPGNSSKYLVEKPFNNVEDGLRCLPPGVQYARYVDLAANAIIEDWALANLSRSIPGASIFGAEPRKDMIATYPFGYFGFIGQFGDPQVVSLSDFGPNFDYKKLNKTTFEGYQLRFVNESLNENYVLAQDTYPVVHGGNERYVATVEYFMTEAATRSAYNNYADLFDQTVGYPQAARNARFAVVGNTTSLSFGDRYFVGITPTDNLTNYKIVVHLNRTLPDEEKQLKKTQWETVAIFRDHFVAYNVQFTDNYLVIDAMAASPETCLMDLVYNWPGFLIA